MQFIRDLNRYWNYIWYSAVSELKGQVQGSYLGWIWWILDPLLFMVVYAFVTIIVFQQKIENFPIFVFLGVITWQFFNATVDSSVNVIRSYAAVTKKVFIPKFVIIIANLMVNAIKFGIGLLIVLVALVVVRVDLSVNILWAIPVIITLIVFTFGVSLFAAHAGVYVSDLQNVIKVILRFFFYMSGVFYTIERIPEHLQTLYYSLVPTGFIINSMRSALMYATKVDYRFLAWWFFIGLAMCIIGLKIMRKHEKEYMKIG